jgi:hypothetical protein
MTAPLKADQQAAERVLKAAVRRAVEIYRAEIPHSAAVYRADDHWCVTQDRAAALLGIAGQSAALLLDERPAKKAAARKGAS